MPGRTPTPCRSPRCPETVVSGRYCDQHRKEHWRDRDRARGERRAEEKTFYDSALWMKTKRAVLRGEPTCRECKKAGRKTLAQMVDHVVPLRLGGDRTDPGNLQPLCNACHDRKRGQETGAVDTERRPVTVVCGPPGSGKSSYVMAHARHDDLVLDLDLVTHALTPSGYGDGDPHYTPVTHLRFGITAREAVLAELEKPNAPTAWLIFSGASAAERERMRQRYQAAVVVLEVPASECLARLYKDEQRRFQLDGLRPVIERWWQDYERASGDTVCKP